MGAPADGHADPFRGDENVLELEGGGGRTASWCVRCIST